MKRRIAAPIAIVALIVSTGTSVQGAMLTIKGTSKGTAAKGPFVRNGVTRMTTDVALKTAQDYVKRYDGAVTFAADYTIKLKGDNTVDSTKSFITLDSLTFTQNGTEVKTTPKFTISMVPITKVTLMNNDPTMIASFKFEVENWYPAGAALANRMMDQMLAGMIDLKTGDSSYTAVYADKLNGAIYTYMVTAKAEPPKPLPDPLPDELATVTPFSPPPIPEPSAVVLLALGASLSASRRAVRSRRC